MNSDESARRDKNIVKIWFVCLKNFQKFNIEKNYNAIEKVLNVLIIIKNREELLKRKNESLNFFR